MTKKNIPKRLHEDIYKRIHERLHKNYTREYMEDYTRTTANDTNTQQTYTRRYAYHTYQKQERKKHK
jgi:hypothetical protein